jgi:class 3 adenylate cyclase
MGGANMPQPGSAKLVVELSDGTIQEHELSDRVMSIGRDPACDIQIPSRYVSRRHAILSPDDNQYVIRDERSTNGLQINGRLVREPFRLTSGDRVVLGDVTLTYEQAAEDPFATAVYANAAVEAGAPSPPETQHVDSSIPVHARPAGLCTILFTDLVDSTRQVTRLGDVAGQRWIQRHTSILREQFAKFQGDEEKWTGDGFVVTFASARMAIHCAMAIQAGLHAYNCSQPDQPMHMRAGLNTGEVLREGNELFGNAVILASRVMSRAGADQILLSELMYRLVQPSGEFRMGDRGLFTIKGLPQRQHLYEVRWQEEES